MKYPLEIPDIKQFRHTMEVQIRFNDIDILGHLNNTVYLSLYDLGKARWMGEVDKGRVNWQRVNSVIANIDCAYIQQVKFGERIFISTRCMHMGKKSYTLQQMMTDDKGNVKSLCDTVMVSYDPDTHEAVEIIESWRKSVEEFEGRKID